MDLQEKYDKLLNIIEDLEMVTEYLQGEKELQDYYYCCVELINQAEQEKDEIEPELQKQYDKELKEREKEFWSMKF